MRLLIVPTPAVSPVADPGGASVTFCTNEEEHEQDVPAVFDVSFPDGRWNGCLACRDCFQIIVDNMLDEPTPVFFVPVNVPAVQRVSDVLLAPTPEAGETRGVFHVYELTQDGVA